MTPVITSCCDMHIDSSLYCAALISC